MVVHKHTKLTPGSGRPWRTTSMRACGEAGIKQSFTRPATPKTNGKAERAIRTLMEGWHANEYFRTHRQHRQSLIRFVNYYNGVKPHKGIDNATPLERLCASTSTRVQGLRACLWTVGLNNA